MCVEVFWVGVVVGVGVCVCVSVCEWSVSFSLSHCDSLNTECVCECVCVCVFLNEIGRASCRERVYISVVGVSDSGVTGVQTCALPICVSGVCPFLYRIVIHLTLSVCVSVCVCVCF